MRSMVVGAARSAEGQSVPSTAPRAVPLPRFAREEISGDLS